MTEVIQKRKSVAVVPLRTKRKRTALNKRTTNTVKARPLDNKIAVTRNLISSLSNTLP